MMLSVFGSVQQFILLVPTYFLLLLTIPIIIVPDWFILLLCIIFEFLIFAELCSSKSQFWSLYSQFIVNSLFYLYLHCLTLTIYSLENQSVKGVSPRPSWFDVSAPVFGVGRLVCLLGVLLI